MQKIELKIIALSQSMGSAQPFAVVLGEVEGQRRVLVVIGAFEAQAIAVVLQNMNPGRPLTHDLIRNLFFEFDLTLKEVIINDLIDSVFYAKLICEHLGNTIEIDSRTSDALALAVRFKCPVYTYEKIMDEAGILVMDEEEQKEKPKSTRTSSKTPGTRSQRTEIAAYTKEKLDTMLQQALDAEDYELAAAVRDEINRRK